MLEILFIICYTISVIWVSALVGLKTADYLIEHFHK